MSVLCAVRIVLAEKDVPYDPVEIDLTDRPALAVREEPGREGARPRGGRLGAAGVGGDRGVSERALPRAAAVAGRPRRARGRATARLPLRGLLEALLRVPARGGGSAGAIRRRARPARRAAPGHAVALRARLRARRHRFPPVADSCERHARDSRWSRGPRSPAWLERASARPSVAAERELVAAL